MRLPLYYQLHKKITYHRKYAKNVIVLNQNPSAFIILTLLGQTRPLFYNFEKLTKFSFKVCLLSDHWPIISWIRSVVGGMSLKLHERLPLCRNLESSAVSHLLRLADFVSPRVRLISVSFFGIVSHFLYL